MDGLPGPLPAGRPRTALVAEVAATLGHLPAGTGVCVALSGGPDSTALAYLVAEARPDLVVTLVHVRHGLRDDAEDRDVVRRHAAWLGLPLVERDVEVERAGRGVEAAARTARYAALRAVAVERGAAAILVGHTADDQAETLLLRLARGTGIDGLAGMAPVRDDVIRPMLRLRRADVRRYVLLEGLPTVEDPTNVDPAVRRSVVRHEVLPRLAAAGPDPVGSLGRIADLARDDAAALDGWARSVADRARRAGPVVAIEDAVLAAEPAAVVRRVVRRLLHEVAAGPPPDAATVARVLALPRGSSLTVAGGVQVTAAGGWRAFAPPRLPASGPVPVAVPGTTDWEPARIAVTAITPDTASLGAPRQAVLALPGVWAPEVPRPDPGAVPPGGHAARLHLTLPASVGTLELRHRRPGDRLRTPGGTRRLQDVLVDAGVPRAARDVWPLVATADGRPLWVPGVAADADVVAAGRHAPALLLVARTSARAAADAGSSGVPV